MRKEHMYLEEKRLAKIINCRSMFRKTAHAFVMFGFLEILSAMIQPIVPVSRSNSCLNTCPPCILLCQ